MRPWVSIETRCRVANTSSLISPYKNSATGMRNFDCINTIKHNRVHVAPEGPAIFGAVERDTRSYDGREGDTCSTGPTRWGGPWKEPLPIGAASHDPTPLCPHQAHRKDHNPHRAQLGYERKSAMQDQPKSPCGTQHS
ncbi:hypothetical protein NITLEN_10741 [Nitrospira lenta]|uniref:Uncharacterized protein n=1 Tax=Nitrospira lenta TaxID=1436998 RepID=A0A330L1M4_9BACT|nr:hypothetical protein NITLEN_10741 [Nitrospira lenta]